jgi:DNA-binding transcriptional MocR family regulator
MDEQGMLPDDLRRVLETTPPSPVTGRKPRCMYIIPSGQSVCVRVGAVHA